MGYHQAAAQALALLLCLVPGAPPRPAAAADLGPWESEADLLLTFKAGIVNWDEAAAARQLQGWTSCDEDPACLPVCNWSGVECNPYLSAAGNFVTALRLPCQADCTVPFHGRLTPGIHRLQHIVNLNLDKNQLSGTLPEEWGEPHSFRALLELSMNDNLLEGSPVPEIWAVGPAFENLADLQLSGNRFSGPFPAGFAVTNTSFWSVMSFNFASNQLTGPLPSYVNGMITMSIVRLENNLFTGTLPPDWGTQGYFWNSSYNATQALEYLSLHGNRLTGTLPPEWGAPGSFTALKQLTLSGNRFQGELPPAWGATNESLPALQDLNVSSAGLSGPLPAWGPYPASLRALTVYGNNLEGTIPTSWSQLLDLQEVILQPGNEALCPMAPEGATFDICAADDVLCMGGLSTDTAACSDVPSDSGSSFPVVAVAVPVAVAGVMAAVLAALLWRRRQRRRAADQQGVSFKDGFYQDPETGLFYPANHKPSPQVQGSQGSGAAAAAVPGPPQAAPLRGGTMADCLPCLKQTRSAELEALPSLSTAGGSVGAQSAPLWLPSSQALQQFPSGCSLPQLPSFAESSGKAERSQRTSLGGGGSGTADESAPALSAKELLALQLSDWEIRPSEIEIMKRPDGSDWQLGSGGFGTVYKARRNGCTPVAVKVLGSANTEVLKAMTDADFAHEISILRACRDTNILQFQGACFQDNRTLLVTEYMEGGSLTHNLRAKKINWYRKGKKIAIDVARALVYLHTRRILHLDIKSANVLLTRDGTAKVGDVGMAKIMMGDYVSGVVGTLAWSAPELLMGQRCDAKADIYSAGVVLWELCTGELPVRGQLRDPRVPEECPAEVVAIMYRCLAIDPAARPSAVELVELLMEASGVPSATPMQSIGPDAVLPSALASPFGACAPTTGSSIGPPMAGAPLTKSSIGDAGVRPDSQRSSFDGQQQRRRQEQPEAGPCSNPSDVASDRASRAGRPPRPTNSASLQSALEESLVSELTDELSREGPHSPLGPLSGVSSVRSQGTRSSRSRREHDSVGGLQRRLVLTSNGSRSSPFTRFTAPPASPPVDAVGDGVA